MKSKLPQTHTQAEIDAFIEKLVERAPAARGRLIFALDATASRQPTWDTACQLQGEMFAEAAAIGGLEVQFVYYRGSSECQASRWVSIADDLARLMAKITCAGGHTQIRKVLEHARREHRHQKIAALIFVGDAMEETLDELSRAAANLGVPAFVFQEGDDPVAEEAFREIARLSKGAYCKFDAGSAQQLRELLRAVAAFAAGGLQALTARKDAGSIRLIGQLRGRRHDSHRAPADLRPARCDRH